MENEEDERTKERKKTLSRTQTEIKCAKKTVVWPLNTKERKRMIAGVSLLNCHVTLVVRDEQQQQ